MIHLPSEQKLSLYSVLLTLTAFALSANAIPPLATTIAQQFTVSYEAFGYVFMLQYLCFTCASLSGGYLHHRCGISSRILVLAGVFGTAVLFLVGSMLSGFFWVLSWIVPLGFAGGLTETFSSVLIAGFEQGNSSRLMNLSQVFYCIGAIASPQLAAILLEAHLSWRLAFLILGICTLCIGIIFMRFNKPISPPLRPQPTSQPIGTPRQMQLPLRHDRLFYLMALLLFLYVVIEISSASWIAAYFEKSFHLSASMAARRLSLFWTGLILGRVMMLVVPARFTLWPGLIGGSFGMCIGNTLLAFSGSYGTATASIFIVGMAAGPIWPIIVMLSQHMRGSARFTSGVIGIGALGAALGPFLGSLVIRSCGVEEFFPVISGASMVLLGLILVTKYTRTRSTNAYEI